MAPMLRPGVMTARVFPVSGIACVIHPRSGDACSHGTVTIVLRPVVTRGRPVRMRESACSQPPADRWRAPGWRPREERRGESFE